MSESLYLAFVFGVLVGVLFLYWMLWIFGAFRQRRYERRKKKREERRRTCHDCLEKMHRLNNR